MGVLLRRRVTVSHGMLMELGREIEKEKEREREEMDEATPLMPAKKRRIGDEGEDEGEDKGEDEGEWSDFWEGLEELDLSGLTD